MGSAVAPVFEIVPPKQSETPQNRATRRNAQAQPGITPEMRASDPTNQNIMAGIKTGAVAATTVGLGAVGAEAAAPYLASTAPLFAAASQKYEQVKEAVGENVVKMTDELSDALQNVSRLGKSGGSIPKPASDLIDRVQDLAKHPEELSWNDLHDFAINMTSKLAPSEIQKMNGPMQRAFGNLTNVVINRLTEVADEGGVGGTFTSARQAWAQASRLLEQHENAIQAAKNAGTMALKGGAGAAGAGTIYGLYRTIADAFK